MASITLCFPIISGITSTGKYLPGHLGARNSPLLESGINLSNSTQPCRLRCIVDNDNSALNVFTYSLSDRLLMIDRDGNLRSSG